MSVDLDQFLDLSIELTCFTRFELRGTGMASDYLRTAQEAAGPFLDTLYARFAALPQGAGRAAALRRTILGDEEVGPVARAITKLWYIGIWYQLPRSWTDKYGVRAANTSFMVSPAAYGEGLLWIAIGAHAPGAKAPGYGSWVGPPVIPSFPGATATLRGPEEEAGPALTQTTSGHVSHQHASTPQHPPPSVEGASL